MNAVHRLGSVPEIPGTLWPRGNILLGWAFVFSRHAKLPSASGLKDSRGDAEARRKKKFLVISSWCPVSIEIRVEHARAEITLHCELRGTEPPISILTRH